MASFNGTNTNSRLKVAPLFRKNLRPRPDSPNLILTLPPELRNHIYWEAMSDPVTNAISLMKRRPPLTGVTCKQIRQEAMAVWYGKCRIEVAASLEHSWEGMAQQLYRIVAACGPRPFSSFYIFLRGEIWSNLTRMLPLLEMMRSTGFEPAIDCYKEEYVKPGRRKHLYTSVFRTRGHTYGNAQFVLEKALSLARRARSEEWPAEKLENRFARFVKLQEKEKGKKAKIFVDLKSL